MSNKYLDDFINAPYPAENINAGIVFDRLQMVFLSIVIDNKCFVNRDISKSCGLVSFPNRYAEWTQPIVDEGKRQAENKNRLCSV